MALNIKHAETHRLAAELARMRGVTLTEAVTVAIRRELEREKRRRSKENLEAQLLEIGRHCAAHMKQPTASSDHASLLYDFEGLPR